ncbi:MAG: copper ion binding protein, partial [Acutalibacteraceae bacterium]
MKKKTLNVEGMSCNACELRIQREVEKLDGVKSVKADCEKNTVTVEFDEPVTIEEIKNTIQSTGYDVVEKQKSNRNTVYILVILLGLYVIARQLGLTELFQKFPTVSEERVSYAVLFVIGLLTSVHCIAMCGGINLTQSVAGKENHPIRKSVLYNAGRLTGYTVVGGILGLI